MHAELNALARERQRELLGVSVGHDEIDTFQARFDHVVDGVDPSASDAEHDDTGLQLGDRRPRTVMG